MVDFALRSCGLRGHATFAPDEPQLRERLTVDTPAGEAWRCLRCETFVVGPPRHSGPANTAPEIPRGRFLRDRTLMRALAIERALRAVIFLAVAAGVFKVNGSRERLRHAFDQDLPLLKPLANQIGWNPDHSKIIHTISHAFSLSSSTLTWIAAGLVGYPAIRLVGGGGLGWGVRGERGGGGGRVVGDATVGRVLRGDRHQRVPSAGNLRADRKDHGPSAFRPRCQHRRGGVAVVEQTPVRAERRRQGVPGRPRSGKPAQR